MSDERLEAALREALNAVGVVSLPGGASIAELAGQMHELLRRTPPAGEAVAEVLAEGWADEGEIACLGDGEDVTVHVRERQLMAGDRPVKLVPGSWGDAAQDASERVREIDYRRGYADGFFDGSDGEEPGQIPDRRFVDAPERVGSGLRSALEELREVFGDKLPSWEQLRHAPSKEEGR